MKKFIRTVSITLSVLTSLSACAINASAVINPFNLERATGGLPSSSTPTIDVNENLSSSSSPLALPDSVDLSESECFPEVGDQGIISSCTAWATTYYQFGYQVAAMNSWNAKNDPTKQFSPKWTYNLINEGKDEGSAITSAYRVLSSQGAVRYSEFTPNSFDESISEFTEWYLDKDGMKQALQYRVSEYKHLSFARSTADTPIISSKSGCLTIMKSLLNSGKVLTFDTDITEWDYEKLTNQYDTSLNKQYVCIKQINVDDVDDWHAMTIVGYDDNITYDLNGDGVIQAYEKGAFKIVNSWGTDYCNDGFVWVMYDALNKVSNAENQNVSTRRPILKDYAYYFIDVQEYPLDLIAEVTLTQSYRNEIKVGLAQSDYDTTIGSDYTDTILRRAGGAFNFSGLGTIPMTTTFVFDYGSLCSSQIVRQNFYVKVTDFVEKNYTTINNIKLIDKTGKIVANDTVNDSIDNIQAKAYRYTIGMVGDVNNDAKIDTQDITDIQNYLAGGIEFSDEDILVADVDGSGGVDITDVMYLQYYIAGIYDTFENGHFVKLN